MTKQQRRWAIWLFCAGVFVVVEAVLLDRTPEWFRWLQIELLLLAYVFKGLWIPFNDETPSARTPQNESNKLARSLGWWAGIHAHVLSSPRHAAALTHATKHQEEMD